MPVVVTIRKGRPPTGEDAPFETASDDEQPPTNRPALRTNNSIGSARTIVKAFSCKKNDYQKDRF
jgi:hypothetical protein